MEGSFMLSMMDHITKRLDVLDKRNDDLYADDTSPTLRFDKSSRQTTKDNLVICGDIFVHSRLVCPCNKIISCFVFKITENRFSLRVD